MRYPLISTVKNTCRKEKQQEKQIHKLITIMCSSVLYMYKHSLDLRKSTVVSEGQTFVLKNQC